MGWKKEETKFSGTNLYSLGLLLTATAKLRATGLLGS